MTQAQNPAQSPRTSASTKPAGSWPDGECEQRGSIPQSLPYACNCGARWAGLNTCHCASGCHETLSSPRAFDKHRRDGRCLDPAAVGLVRSERAGYVVWGFPSDEAATERLRAARGGGRA